LESAAAPEIPELKGGDWARGRALFSGEQARCSTCHSVRGHGGRIGPDLSNLIHRDYASVLRDIHTPNAAINPDYIAYAVELRDGRVLQGAVRAEKDRLIVSDTAGKQTAVPAPEVERMTASSASIMPEGLDAALGPAKLRDLMTYLLAAPLQPAPIEREQPPAPPARSRAEVDAALAGSAVVEAPKRLKIILTDGPKDHGPGEHDYPLWRKRWNSLLATDETIAVETADAWPSPEQLKTADVVVLYSNNPAWDAARAAELDRFLARGGGLVLIHYAVDGHKDAAALADRIGLAWQGGKAKFRHGPLEVDFSKSKHPIARNLGVLRFVDESYWDLVGEPGAIDVIGTGVEEGHPRPLFWARQAGKGRTFVSIPGHYTWTFDDPLFRLLILRGIAWTAGESVDRFNGLATLGARVQE
jgi:putative heme-binding domain-containing protein